MKNYSSEVINSIQNAINLGKYKIIKLSSYDEMPKTVYIGGMKLTLINNGSIHDTVSYPDYTFSTADTKEWKNEPAGRFYSKDWKLANKGNNQYELYYFLNVFVGEVEVNALLRIINIDDFNGDQETFEYSTAFIIGEQSYALIKAYSPSISESYSIKSTLEEDTFTPKMSASYGLIDINNPDADIEEGEDSDDSESVELF